MTEAPLLEGKAQNQLDKAIDGYCKLRDQRRGEVGFIRTALEIAMASESPLERDRLIVELLSYVKGLS